MADVDTKKCPDCPENCPRYSDTCHVFCKTYKEWSGRQARARDKIADDYCVKKSVKAHERWRKNHANR